jgi:hypothetical protein
MRRRDSTIGLLLAAAAQSVQAQERAKQHRIAIVIPAGAVAINPCRLPLKLCHQLR